MINIDYCNIYNLRVLSSKSDKKKEKVSLTPSTIYLALDPR